MKPPGYQAGSVLFNALRSVLCFSIPVLKRVSLVLCCHLLAVNSVCFLSWESAAADASFLFRGHKESSTLVVLLSSVVCYAMFYYFLSFKITWKASSVSLSFKEVFRRILCEFNDWATCCIILFSERNVFVL